MERYAREVSKMLSNADRLESIDDVSGYINQRQLVKELTDEILNAQ